jgi:hypothetical protein
MRIIFVYAFWAVFFCMNAQASLMITPTRVVLDERNRTVELTLVNSSTEQHTYRLGFIEQKQTESGGYVALPTVTPEDRIASPMLRFSPRQVTIEPGKYQRIRIRVNMPADLADGEYLSHLKLSVVAPNRDVGENDGQETKRMSISMRLNLSYTLPVIVRKGPMSIDTAISRIDLDSATNELLVRLTRKGLQSSFGGLVVEMQEYAGAPVTLVGQLNNVALFSSVEYRDLRVKLLRKIPEGAVIRIRYNGADEFEGRLLGESTFKYTR